MNAAIRVIISVADEMRCFRGYYIRKDGFTPRYFAGCRYISVKRPTDLKKHLALYLFEERILSFGKAAELSGLSKLAFIELAGSRGISLNYDTDDYAEDMNTVRALGL